MNWLVHHCYHTVRRQFLSDVGLIEWVHDMMRGHSSPSGLRSSFSRKSRSAGSSAKSYALSPSYVWHIKGLQRMRRQWCQVTLTVVCGSNADQARPRDAPPTFVRIVTSAPASTSSAIAATQRCAT